MVETTIQLKPQDQWRPGMTMDKIIAELDKTVRLPGLANLWVPPIRNRIDMLLRSKAQLALRCQVMFWQISTPRRSKSKRCQNRAGRLFGAG
jgi:hypothetical protein